MSLNPLQHAEHVTGCRQSALIDLWSRCGLTVAISEVTRPHVYDYGRLPVSTVAITLYNVRRHVLIEDGRTRRDAPVRFGRFRIGQPGRNVIVDAVPEPGRGKLVLFYLGGALLREAAAAQGHDRAVSLTDLAWETEDDFLTAAACRLVEASDRHLPPGPLLAEQLAYTVALHLTERHAALPPPCAAEPLPYHALPAQLRERVLADPALPLGIAELAAEAGLSPSAFTRAFRRASGQTPHRFILEQRLQAARTLLAESDRPLVDIALSLGFASQSHFGAAFRAATGASPARYRAARRG